MSAVSNASGGSQPQIPSAPAPSICTITLPNGELVPSSALHNELTPQYLPLQDPNPTFHIIPLPPSNHAPFEHFDDDTLWRWIGITPPARTPSPPQPSSPETSFSSTAIPVPPPTPLAQGFKARRKGTAAPKSQVVPTYMTFVFRTRLHGGSPSSNVRAKETLSPPTSIPSSGPSRAHQTSASSRRDSRCTCSLRPHLDWARHWRRSCPHNPGRRYPCPKGCGREFTRKDNAKRHVKLDECPRAGANELPPERPPDVFSSFSFSSFSSFSSASSSSSSPGFSPNFDLLSNSSSPSM